PATSFFALSDFTRLSFRLMVGQLDCGCRKTLVSADTRAARLPRLRAVCNSDSTGWREPSGPARVPGPYGEPPMPSVTMLCGFWPYGLPMKIMARFRNGSRLVRVIDSCAPWQEALLVK